MNRTLRHCCSLKASIVLFSVSTLMLAGGWNLWSLEWGRATTSVNQDVNSESSREIPSKPTGKKHDQQYAVWALVAQQLHQEAYEHFINQAGMGRSRLTPTLNVVKREWKMPEWTSEELAKQQQPLKVAKDLEVIHGLSMKIFTNSNTMTEKERMESAFKNPPPKKEHFWEIKSLDLVGLVTHENPIVYVSEKLPEMKDLQKTPTRDLDLFESEGLEELMNGKNLYIRGKGETVRVLGPIKAGKTCLNCHDDAKEGTMLGAFSYTLRPGQYRLNGPGIPPGGRGIQTAPQLPGQSGGNGTQ